MHVVLALLTGLALVVAGIVALDRLPPQHSPFAPLSLAQPIGWATAGKLGRLHDDPERCLGLLQAAPMRIVPIADRRTGPFCGFSNAVEVQRSHLRYGSAVRVSCPLAAALHLWERDVVAPAARRHLDGSVARIEHMGTYNCRRIGGGATGRPSEHATANAIDIAGFTLTDGRRITLVRGWQGTTAEQAFLREVRDGACRVFRVVLGPDHDAAHLDHFHFDMGAFRACR